MKQSLFQRIKGIWEKEYESKGIDLEDFIYDYLEENLGLTTRSIHEELVKDKLQSECYFTAEVDIKNETIELFYEDED